MLLSPWLKKYNSTSAELEQQVVCWILYTYVSRAWQTHSWAPIRKFLYSLQGWVESMDKSSTAADAFICFLVIEVSENSLVSLNSIKRSLVIFTLLESYYLRTRYGSGYERWNLVYARIGASASWIYRVNKRHWATHQPRPNKKHPACFSQLTQWLKKSVELWAQWLKISDKSH